MKKEEIQAMIKEGQVKVSLVEWAGISSSPKDENGKPTGGRFLMIKNESNELTAFRLNEKVAYELLKNLVCYHRPESLNELQA